MGPLATVIPNVMTIAGSDSSGAAGVQADLRTFAEAGVRGWTAITAVTAQDDSHVAAVHSVSPAIVREQIAVAAAAGLGAAKTGMLLSPEIVEAAASSLEVLEVPNLVVDPVLLSSSGARLLAKEAIGPLVERLLPLARVLTPNLDEASALLGRRVGTVAEMKEAAEALQRLGPQTVLVKGGHLKGKEAVDVLYDGVGFTELTAARIAPAGNVRGTGCVLSAAIAAHLAHGRPLTEAVREAKKLITEAISRD